MPTSMTDEELEASIVTMAEVDRFDYRNPESDDDYFNAVLAMTVEGRHFRFIESAGMDSHFGWVGNSDGEWLEEAEVADWSKTYEQWAE
jgi:hypothetical protein